MVGVILELPLPICAIASLLSPFPEAMPEGVMHPSANAPKLRGLLWKPKQKPPSMGAFFELETFKYQ
ncbi:hypothetical protein [Laspinema palackyanum]|uniref:hypothetical protein n=1 Tax=Laspinema palackyanum TaxID=3231601 RepID=UPI00349F7B7C